MSKVPRCVYCGRERVFPEDPPRQCSERLSLVCAREHPYDNDMADDTAISRRLCAHADDDGAGMHWLEPGEVCDRPDAEQTS